MPDPGALGTLLIGLESVRLDDEIAAARRQRQISRQRTSHRVLTALAAGLRGVADRLDRPVTRPAVG